MRFQITAPLLSAAYCHCTHCQKRTGTAVSAQGRVRQADFELLQGRENLRGFTPPGSKRPKLFCVECGSHLFAGDPETSDPVIVRLGVIDGDPGVRPSVRGYVRSAAAWEPIPDDSLPRFEGPPPR